MNTNWITVALIVIGLFIAIGGGLRDAYRDFRNKRGYVTWGQIAESSRIAREADICFSIVKAPTRPYDWQNDE